MPETISSTDVVLAPGGFHFGRGDYRVRTLLGSCVAVTLWHPVAHIGGMSHFLLPGRGSSSRRHDEPFDGRFADESMAMFQNEIDKACTRASEYQAKIFGGGDQFPKLSTANRIDVAERNVAAAIALCAHHGFTIMSKHLGLSGSRQVVLDLASGDVWMRHRALPELTHPDMTRIVG
jgi:chemotaxis protein CheD